MIKITGKSLWIGGLNTGRTIQKYTLEYCAGTGTGDGSEELFGTFASWSRRRRRAAARARTAGSVVGQTSRGSAWGRCRPGPSRCPSVWTRLMSTTERSSRQLVTSASVYQGLLQIIAKTTYFKLFLQFSHDGEWSLYEQHTNGRHNIAYTLS